MNFPVVIHKDPDSDYGVTVPDLPGCFSAAETLDGAIAGAKEAITCHLEGMLIDNEPVPVPLTIETHQQDEALEGGTWALVEVDLSKLSLKAKRVNVTMPERLVRSVDRYARKQGMTRSGLLAQAVTEYMAQHPE